MTDTKSRAAKLLREYDRLRAELRLAEAELRKECAAYGRESGVWGMNKDMLRAQLEREARGTKAA